MDQAGSPSQIKHLLLKKNGVLVPVGWALNLPLGTCRTQQELGRPRHPAGPAPAAHTPLGSLTEAGEQMAGKKYGLGVRGTGQSKRWGSDDLGHVPYSF